MKPWAKTLLAALGVVGLVVVVYVTYLLTVVYRPIDIYSVTYEVSGAVAPARIEYLHEPTSDRDKPPVQATVDGPTLPWKEEVAIPPGTEARVSIADPAAGLSCVITLDKGRSRERVLATRTAEPGQPLVCTARTPTGETLNGALPRPTPR
ncbi:hypothetical protein N8J89_30825 [Crossiella sp. CA-258035]|uniref:hypothetical protein n=1 Tax=Crossiella sp. CA-258035 TaxID=2981138 RepID=UPI0024BD5A37|nr:hypothetical protein [Crossiella sp. CA-258035]WHT17495.1 hypothetical protein N8J89_30825 [Crossiella sp. CA-258035]